MSAVTVIVPTWNRPDLIAQLLDLLAPQSHPIQEVLVVDNGSEDGTRSVATSRGARVISMRHNAGFTRAVNCGIRQSQTEWVAILNNDVAPATDWLEHLLAGALDAGAWFATGRILDATRRDTIDGTYDTLCRGGCPWRTGRGALDGPEWAMPRRIRFAPFTAVLCRRQLFEKVGFLDESFESYLEDIDFCLRCAIRGYDGAYVPKALAYHAGSATLGSWHPDTVRRIARNQLLLVAKHYPAGSLLRYGWPVAVAQLLWGLLAFRHRAGLAYLSGKVEGSRLFLSTRRRAFHEAATSGAQPEQVARILEESEQELFDVQQRIGFDLYWRLYFALT